MIQFTILSQAQNAAFGGINTLYGKFVGQPHFESMTRLLGYQGIAVVIEELLKVIKSLVSYTTVDLAVTLIRKHCSDFFQVNNCYRLNQMVIFGLILQPDQRAGLSLSRSVIIRAVDLTKEISQNSCMPPLSQNNDLCIR